MASKYKRYLAEHVLNEQEHVTYRSLSRALKVHCNHAKRMLYDFHRLENAKKPNSVNATYIVIGIPEQTQERPMNGTQMTDDGDDDVMQSSPFMSSQVPQPDEVESATPVTAIMLVREEELSDVKRQFKSIFSIFMYSVQSTSPPDLNVLADLGHTILESQPEDPLEHGARYGMIQNKNMKRRTRAAPVAAASSSKATMKTEPAKPSRVSQPVKAEKTEEESPKEEEQPRAPAAETSEPVSQAPVKTQGQATPTQKPAQPKRDGSSIFKAFAKAKPRPKKEDEETPGTPAAQEEKSTETEDVIMGDESEGEDQEDLFLDTGARSNNPQRETRKEREEKLKQMMDDEEMPDAPSPGVDEPAAVDQETTVEGEPKESKESKEPKVPESTEASSAGRRRRGRRQVMKKKTLKDAEGYLVTREEPVWESFSEDETEPTKSKPSVSGGGRPAKAKSGQGNIMSFFGKKQ